VTIPPLFASYSPEPDDPNNDAAPGGAGAGVNVDKNHQSDALRARFNPPVRKNAPPGTSDVAAQRIARHSAVQRAKVYAVFVRAGVDGATDAEVEAATGIRAQSESSCRGELRVLALVVDSGRRRPTPRGRPAAVWVTANYAPKPEGGAA